MKLHLQLGDLRSRTWSTAEAFDYCRDLAISHYENFVVGSILMPREIRPHLFSVYAFCRWADDLGDEVGDAAVATRLLKEFDAEVDECFAGRARHPVFVALADTVHRFRMTPQPFHDLIRAFLRDQVQTRYASFTDLLDYCVYSANPVGHLFLSLFGSLSDETARLSDRICTGLQLANHWQDVSVDIARGRVYLPQEDLDRFAVSEESLSRPIASPAFRAMMKFEVDRARGFFDEGAPLAGIVPRRFRVDVEMFRLGGLAILDRIEAQRFDVLARRPTVSKWRQGALLLKALFA